jgi:hypothetical protein
MPDRQSAATRRGDATLWRTLGLAIGILALGMGAAISGKAETVVLSAPVVFGTGDVSQAPPASPSPLSGRLIESPQASVRPTPSPSDEPAHGRILKGKPGTHLRPFRTHGILLRASFPDTPLPSAPSARLCNGSLHAFLSVYLI